MLDVVAAREKHSVWMSVRKMERLDKMA